MYNIYIYPSVYQLDPSLKSWCPKFQPGADVFDAGNLAEGWRALLAEFDRHAGTCGFLL